jgi:prolipoprotein diacylglyceryltransferase
MNNQQTVAETFNQLMLPLKKVLKDKAKMTSLMMIIIQLIITVISCNKQSTNPTQQQNIIA